MHWPRLLSVTPRSLTTPPGWSRLQRAPSLRAGRGRCVRRPRPASPRPAPSYPVPSGGAAGSPGRRGLRRLRRSVAAFRLPPGPAPLPRTERPRRAPRRPNRSVRGPFPEHRERSAQDEPLREPRAAAPELRTAVPRVRSAAGGAGGPRWELESTWGGNGAARPGSGLWGPFQHCRSELLKVPSSPAVLRPRGSVICEDPPSPTVP